MVRAPSLVLLPTPGVGRQGRWQRPRAVSACVIARNEADRVPGLFDSLAGSVDEVVLVDTGSTDDTADLARARGARVLERAWDDDFAAARNAALEAARGEWILVIDADERLERADGGRWRHADLVAALEGGGADVYDVWVVNMMDEQDSGVLDQALTRRLFRNYAGMRFVSRIHEQIALPPGCRYGRLDAVRLRHYGYTRAAWARGKRERNLRLLERLVAEAPEDPAPHFFLGREYAQVGRGPEALHHLGRAVDLLGVHRPPYWWELTTYWLEALHRSGRPAATVAACDRVLAEYPMFSEAQVVRGRALRDLGEPRQALEAFLLAAATHGRDERILLRVTRTPAVALYEAGRSLEALGRPGEALGLYLAALQAWPWLEDVLHAAVALALGRGVPPEELEARVLRAAGDRARAWLEAGPLWRAYFAAGAWTEAARWAEAEERAHGTWEAAERLALARLRAGDPDGAAEAFARAEARLGAIPGGDAAWARFLLAARAGDRERARRCLEALGPQESRPAVQAARRWLADGAPEPGEAAALLGLAAQFATIGAGRAAAELARRAEAVLAG